MSDANSISIANASVATANLSRRNAQVALIQWLDVDVGVRVRDGVLAACTVQKINVAIIQMLDDQQLKELGFVMGDRVLILNKSNRTLLSEARQVW
jgi:myosin-crossreactive antigen